MQNKRVPDDTGLAGLVDELASELFAIGWTMSAAESCTGGWIAKCCTDLAGSSAWFDRGFVTYSNESKHELLGVDEKVLRDTGAVSREVALQMVAGAKGRAGTDVAVAVTGIAGPGGGSSDKPVGTVWLAWATRESLDAEMMVFHGDRESIRRLTVQHALRGLIDRL
jgi:nicotinamide-nucleotide amidase